ncbi:MAG TPA: GNAT family N-acetyltransferase [Thermomicrobiaceae bacterium]|nr:GNAT family N-acetyltransferase [Thermomicrobiaceae bacterium]
MELQANALYRHDAVGRLLSVNTLSHRPAPRVFVGRTLEGNVVRFRYDLPDDLAQQLAALIQAEPLAGTYDELERSPGYLDEAIRLLAEYGPVEAVWHGPAWTFPAQLASHDTPTRPVDRSNSEVVVRWFPWLIEELEDSWPCLVVREDGDAVAVCRSVRTTADAVEAGVETVEAYRDRGYASAVVRAWAREVRSAGLVPLYSTSWDNLASRGVARKLGLRLYGADLNIT